MVLAGPFSSVSLLVTDKDMGKWVNTQIKGILSLVQLKDVGVPIAVVRIWQENDLGDSGNLVYEAEFPLNFTMEKISGNLTAISCLRTN